MDNESDARPEPILVEIIGEMHRYRWPDTGEEFYMTVSMSLPRLPDMDDVDLILVINEKAPFRDQIFEARKFFPSLQGRHISEVVLEAKRCCTVALGRFRFWDADRIIYYAGARGLEVRIDPTAPSSRTPDHPSAPFFVVPP